MTTLVRLLVASGVFSLPLAASAVELPEWPEVIAWTPAYQGVERADVVLSQPRPLRLHALRIDLTAEGLSIVTDKGNGDRPDDVDGVKTSTFLVREGCQAAINASAFWPLQDDEGGPQDIKGVVISNGRLVSGVETDKARQVLLLRDGFATITASPVDLSGIETAIGGYGLVLQDGVVVRPQEIATFVDNLHPRTAVGVADDGRTLLLVVVDGRQKGYSEGVHLAELGEMLRLLGAVDGLNLDGGGTTTMTLAAPDGGFRLVNRPIHGGEPGRERVSASHLGVVAKPLQ